MPACKNVAVGDLLWLRDCAPQRQVRYVRVKDYRLGIPNMLITVAIVIKIFIIDLIVDGGYL